MGFREPLHGSCGLVRPVRGTVIGTVQTEHHTAMSRLASESSEPGMIE